MSRIAGAQRVCGTIVFSNGECALEYVNEFILYEFPIKLALRSRPIAARDALVDGLVNDGTSSNGSAIRNLRRIKRHLRQRIRGNVGRENGSRHHGFVSLPIESTINQLAFSLKLIRVTSPSRSKVGVKCRLVAAITRGDYIIPTEEA
jgi:hypothetical protein